MLDPLLRDRPQGEREALQWDMEIGQAYKRAANKDAAFQHFFSVLIQFREEHLRLLVQGEEEGGQYRKALWLIDSLLRIPDKMVTDGKEAERSLGEDGRNG